MRRLLAILLGMLMIAALMEGGCAQQPPAPEATEGKPCAGYTLLSRPGAPPGRTTVLIDMEGNVVHEWPIQGMPVIMLPGGSALGTRGERGGPPAAPPPGPPPPGAGPPRGGPPPGPQPWHDAIEVIQVSWDGEVEWSFRNWDDDGTGTMMSRQHHDLQREGNPVGYYAPGQEFIPGGKTLILAHKRVNAPQISDKPLKDDVIYEVDGNGNLTGFEWYATDHFNEYGFDDLATEAIYNNPQYDEDKGCGDWLHLNSMSLLGKNHWYDETGDERFNPENIMICSRIANFVAIISRQTGNIVWKVGPDFGEGTPEHNLGQFIGPHHAHMIPHGLPGAGNILVFDNGGKSGYGGGPAGFPRYARDYSRVIEFNPVTLEIIWEYTAEGFFAHQISSAQRLPNGNTLITEGTKGRVFEVTPDKKIVWEFLAPAPERGPNHLYRAYRIPPEWVPGNPAGYPEWAKLYK